MPEVRDLLRTGLLCVLVTLAAALVFFGPGVFLGSRLFFTHEVYGSDFWHLNYPFRKFYADGLAEGRLPLWCPDLGLGHPLLADGQVGALYPVNLLLYFLLPLRVALNWELLLHLVGAGAFAGMLARQLGANRGGSALSAVVFGLCGFFLVHLKHANMLIAGAFFPLILLLMERYAAGRRQRTLALLAVVIGASALGGHPQVFYYNLLLASFFGAWLLVRAARRPRERGGGGADAGRLCAGLLLAAVLGGLLAAPQILPAFELKQVGPREKGLSAEDASRWGYELEDLVGFVDPKIHGDPGELRRVPALNPETGEPLVDPRTNRPVERLVGFEAPGRRTLFWETTGYVGLLPLLLALLALVLARPRRPAIAMTVLLLLSLLLALGPEAGLFTLFRKVVPGFDLFRFTGRFLLYADCALAVLAGLGLTAVSRRLARPFPRLARAAVPLAILVTALDIYLALGDHNPKVEADKWLRTPPLAKRILDDEGPPFRILTVDPDRRVFRNGYYAARGWKGDLGPYVPAWNMLDPNLSMLYGIDNTIPYSPLAVRWVTDITLLLFLPPERPGAPPSAVNALVASLLNVRYFIDPFRVFRGRLEPLAEYQGGMMLPGLLGTVDASRYSIRLYRNPREFPRAFLVPRARRVTEDGDRPADTTPGQAAVLAPGFDPRTEVLISGDGEVENDPSAPATPIESPVEILEYAPHRIRMKADAPTGCWLVTSDTFYPGWVAEVDGAATPILRANIAGRAVRLPAGKHEIVFTYRPVPFRIGLGGAALALAVLAALGLIRRRRPEAGPSRSEPEHEPPVERDVR